MSKQKIVKYGEFLLYKFYNLNLIIQQMLNIPSTVVDSNYRYRMPRMQLKIESKGNGIKTNIVNLADVAKHLRIDQLYILKFFGYEKASQTSEKVAQNKSKASSKTNTSYIIQGQFSEQQLLKTLDKFIEKYVLCPKCKLPELHLHIVNQKINGKCDSCPFNGEMDNKHKLTSHILKNPPTYKTQAIKANKIIQKVQQKSQQKTQGSQKPVKKQKVQQKQAIKKVQQQSANKLFSADNLEFGSVQMKQLIQYTKKFIEARKGQDFDISSAQVVQNLKSLNLKKTLFAFVIFNALFTVNIAKQVKDNAEMYLKLMRRLVGSSEQNNEVETLLNLQYIFLQANKQQDYSKYIPTILSKLEQNKLLSKNLILKWSKKEIKDLDKFFLYNEARNQQFLSKAAPFIQSLQQNDDEEEDN